MSDSRYKIEYVQPETSTKNNFKFLGAFGYLWLALLILLASALTYGFINKYISIDKTEPKTIVSVDTPPERDQKLVSETNNNKQLPNKDLTLESNTVTSLISKTKKDHKEEKDSLTPLTKLPLTKSLAELAKKSLPISNENDLAYINALKDYEAKKIVTNDFIEKIKLKENKSLANNSSNKSNNPKQIEVSAVDAIIAAMNAEKAAKEKPSQSKRERIQSEINLLLKNEN